LFETEIDDETSFADADLIVLAIQISALCSFGRSAATRCSF